MNGAAESGSGNVKVTREDWLKAALEVLVSDGVEQVKVLTLGARLGVSRSSFYWYFKSRQDLLDALLDHWMATNTRALVAQAEAPAETITGAVCNVFRCMVSDALFDTRLDFAIRDWARRAATVRRVLELSDTQRVQALASMFRRFGYDGTEAFVRARVLYYMAGRLRRCRPERDTGRATAAGTALPAGLYRDGAAGRGDPGVHRGRDRHRNRRGT